MTDDARERLRGQLLEDEGLRLKPYRCTSGKLTIGVGRNLDDVGITAVEAYTLLDNDIDKAIRQLVAAVPWVLELDDVRKAVLVNLTFNMGIAGLLKFVNTLAAIECGQYHEAADMLRRSKWFTQVQPSRSGRLMEMMRSGEWPRTQRA